MPSLTSENRRFAVVNGTPTGFEELAEAGTWSTAWSRALAPLRAASGAPAHATSRAKLIVTTGTPLDGVRDVRSALLRREGLRVGTGYSTRLDADRSSQVEPPRRP